MIKPSVRFCFFAACLVSFILLILDALLQATLANTTCASIFVARLLFLLLALTFLAGTLFNLTKLSLRLISWSAIFVCLVGAGSAGRHIWIQHLSATSLATLPHITAAQLQTASFTNLMFYGAIGHAECVQVTWSWLSLSLASWTLIAFVLLGIFAFWQQTRKVYS